MLLSLLAVCLLVAAVFVGLRQAGGGGVSADADAGEGFDLVAARAELEGAPAPLAGLHAQANQLLAATPAEFRRRLAALEGHPVVINKWASWCGPCRAEMPVLQDLAVSRGREIAFIGLDWEDSTAAGREFLDRYPVPYPSYEDPDGKIADTLKLPKNAPVTLFLDENGEPAYVHQGGYRSSADLEADIDRYLGDGA